jgi:hypothetical protein
MRRLLSGLWVPREFRPASMADLHENSPSIHRNWLSGLLLIAFFLWGCQSQKPVKSQITDPNTVFAQGGAHAESSATPGHGGGRRSRGQFQGVNAAGAND